MFGMSSCIGALSHLYTGIGAGAAIAIAVFVTLATSLAAVECARAPYRAKVIEEEPKARVRDAVLSDMISAELIQHTSLALLIYSCTV
jgi:multisubunit Na+/H+ antiporter MnhG subunit